MRSEYWKWIKGFEGRYEISTEGRVMSFWRDPDGHILKPAKNKSGHWQCYIGGKTQRIHRLVLEHFGGKQPTSLHECCHIDGNPDNNHISNLRWGTRQDNINDRAKHGTTAIGRKNGLNKLTESEILAIRKLRKEGVEVSALAKKYGVCKSNISQITLRQTWQWLK